MSDALIGFGDLLSAPAAASALPPVPRSQPAVAVLTAAVSPQPAAAGIALALASACRARTALVACVGSGPPGRSLHLPASLATAARLRRDGLAARACGRLVWLPAPPSADAAAALSVTLAGAARSCGLPAVLGIGGPRCDEVDRVLARCSGVVVVLPGDAAPQLAAATVESIVRLGPPAAVAPAPRRLDASGALAGLRRPRGAADAVAALGVGEGRR